MPEYDVLLIHPPAIYDFREKPIFPGPIAYNVGVSTDQFIIPPLGMLSIADYLDRNGYRVLVDNIGERMLTDSGFDVEGYLRRSSAKVYAIGLHWCVHSQGAIELARVCKRLHPDALVVLGGLTATVFHEEILSRYEFVDAVIRGEAEKPFLSLMHALEKHERLETVPNLTFRDGGDEITSVPLMEPNADLDEFEFTRLDLLEPQSSVYPPGVLPNWSIPICRGCVYNCVSCGGSAYSYKTHLGRAKPAFRSPEKIAQDIRNLLAQGVQLVYLFQDPRMGGRGYWTNLIKTLQREKFPVRQLTMELFGPADEEYMRELSKIGVPVTLSISSESCVDAVRSAHGRGYTNEDLHKTIELCRKYEIRLGIFSMIALAEDTPETVRANWGGWAEIGAMNRNGHAPVDYAFGPMILLDPGSLAFDAPERHGYVLHFKNLEDYIRGLSLPAWHQWVSYETKHLDKERIVQLIIDSLEYSINLREKLGFYSKSEAETARYCFVKASRDTIDMVDRTMNVQDEEERWNRLRSFRESLDRNIPHLELESHWPKRYVA